MVAVECNGVHSGEPLFKSESQEWLLFSQMHDTFFLPPTYLLSTAWLPVQPLRETEFSHIVKA